ncbi:SMP-30/gluconolactonase/LRE family protein [Gilvibacter sediminis]|uniref:SMP-30/gluconolactonase/LRE family protein n=1 Tax=Gilvibacter sediminis TaxID=379071 RepID=UPI0023504CD5|nr:SMP-30/gluconolactonase/LRE family protein [Gilvibacter sediminis]MDC7998322.1 SMP-30/gluconolactonase/LRE family protein [Gilvibacter sediminis]
MIPNWLRLSSYSALLLTLSLSCKSEAQKPSEEPQDPPKEAVQLAFENKSELGEGPVWNAKTQELYWVDILNKELHIFSPDTQEDSALKVPSRIGTVVPYSPRQAVVALEDGIYKINLQSGDLELLSDVEKEETKNRFNDGKCDPAGNLWVGSMNLAENEASGNLYKIQPDGTTTKMLDSITISNGIVWDRRATTMYYIDTPTGVIRAFDYDKNTASISNERVVVKVDPADGFPDGMAIDENNNLWVGLWNGNAVVQYNSKTGEMMQKVEVPAHNVTAAAFGGPDLDILYITSARVDMTDEELEKYPLAGSVFSYKPGVKGQKADVFGQSRFTENTP